MNADAGVIAVAVAVVTVAAVVVSHLAAKAKVIPTAVANTKANVVTKAKAAQAANIADVAVAADVVAAPVVIAAITAAGTIPVPKASKAAALSDRGAKKIANLRRPARSSKRPHPAGAFLFLSATARLSGLRTLSS